MGRVWNKFTLLMWKNYKQHIRHPIQTLLEVLAPVLFAVILLGLRSLIPLSNHDDIRFAPFEASVPPTTQVLSQIVWSPSDPLLNKIINDTLTNISKKNSVLLTHRSFENRQQLNKYLKNEVNMFSTLAAVEFKDDFDGEKDLDKQINITLRFPAELRTTMLSSYDTWRTFYYFAGSAPGPREETENDGALPNYNKEGFLILQQELSLSFIRHLKTTLNGTEPELPPIYLQRYPHPAWVTDKLMTQIHSSVGIMFLLAYIYTTINIVRTVTCEKEKQLKEVMKIMGLPNTLHWTVWTLKFFISLTVTAGLIVTVLETGWYTNSGSAVFSRTDPTVLFVFLICFSCATICFCFAVTSFFTSASTAATFTGLLWFLLYVPYYFIERFYSRYTFLEKMATCLCSNTAMAYGFRLILKYEEAGIGLNWDAVLKFSANEPSLGYIMIMLLVDSILYFLIALYVGAIFPGDYGVPEKWYFPFSCTYWFGASYSDDATCLKQNLQDSEHFEKEPIYLQAGISIKGLSKEFKGRKLAVDDLTLNMYKNQISVVLGHNGAGKTTTMSMLIGMFPPTRGTATVGGCDIRTNIAGVRKSLGLCPQHNVLFDDLTVSEHLYFYSRLKGLERDDAHGQIEKYIKILELEQKVNAKASTLSGGMKRKLCVAVAFCGNSEVVVLDEPTAGMDPSARRLIWDLLQTEKKGRTIVLTTHFMDEADYLGDRIAIMSNGKLQCCGSSFFLKKKYGAGYHLIIDRTKNCSVPNITALLSKYIPNIKVASNVGSELVYLLSEEYAEGFELMLRDLEENLKGLGINTYGISLTTLEEVFMKVGAEKSINAQEDFNGAVDDFQIMETLSEDSFHSQSKLCKDDKLLSGWKLWLNQLQATFIKRFLSLLRNWILLVVQIIIPIVFVIFLIIINLNAGERTQLPDFMMTLDYYKDSVTQLSTHKNNSFTASYIQSLANDNHTAIDWGNVDFETQMLEQMIKYSQSDMRYRSIVGATMHENQSITGWFSNAAYHSAPLSLQLILNAILHKEVSPQFNIQFFNHPLQYSDLNTKLVSLMEGTSDETSIALNISFSMAFVASFYVLFYIKERANKAKHLQFVSGMNVMPFWIPSILTDYFTFTITCVCLILTMAPFQLHGFATVPEIGRLLSLLMSFGFGMLPIMYLSTFLFNSSSTGFTWVTFFNIFSGVGPFLVMQIVVTTGLNVTVTNVLDWIFIIFPHYSLSDGLTALVRINSVNSLCSTVIDKCVNTKLPNFPTSTRVMCKIIVCNVESNCCHMNKEKFYVWSSSGILRNIVISIVVGLVALAVMLCIEYKGLRRLSNRLSTKRSKNTQKTDELLEEDNDVQLERQIVQNLSKTELSDTSLVMENVTKYYSNSAAVRELSLVVNRYECFGLLGVNGAGKTTTFKIMTGDITATAGNAWIYGLSLDSEMKAIQRLIGYCPQFDALLDELTARETLVIFGLIRGISKRKMKYVAEKLAIDFDFYKHLDKKVKELSGGNKRKLSTSLALIGDPMILFLDEPTTGMDPVTKRYIWDCICKVRDSGKSIVLTSHSMEECEALCTRLAIMVNGRLMCLGSTQHLKNKFSNTCMLTIKLKRTEEESSTERIEHFVRRNFQNAQLRERHKELLLFSISGEHQRWSEMFGIMEGARRYLNIDDYSLGQCSLEQVFLRLTKYQTND